MSVHDAHVVRPGDLNLPPRSSMSAEERDWRDEQDKFAPIDRLYGEQDAYWHNGDDAVMRRLGLKTWGFRREFTEVGTVEVFPAEEREWGMRPATTVKVEVIALPAHSWRFTVTRDDEHNPGHAETRIITTGSGSFGEYWPSVLKVADHCFEVEQG